MDKIILDKIVKIFGYLAEQKGKELEIVDRITTVENSYDRHFTTTSRFKFLLIHFGVRTSGGIAVLLSENESFEFRADSIQTISQNENKIEFTLKVKNSVFRYIQILIL